MRRTLKEACEIAGQHKTPADKVCMEIFAKRDAAQKARRDAEFAHECGMIELSVWDRNIFFEVEARDGNFSITCEVVPDPSTIFPDRYEKELIEFIGSPLWHVVHGIRERLTEVLGPISAMGDQLFLNADGSARMNETARVAMLHINGTRHELPEWAKWLAVNEYGDVGVFAETPVPYSSALVWRSVAGMDTFLRRVELGRCVGWRETLCPLTVEAWKEWEATMKGENDAS